MGAWGKGPFDNDSAHDWLLDAEDVEPDQAVLDALEAVQGVDYIEVDEGSAVVAAATILLAAMRREPLAGPEPAVRMAAALEPTSELRELAVAALDVVLGDRSELAELWAEGGEPDEWRRETEALRDAIARG
ncbi:MAG TPA: DUF4259 domain-containing protein [Sandaracinaceae bacterium]